MEWKSSDTGTNLRRYPLAVKTKVSFLRLMEEWYGAWKVRDHEGLEETEIRLIEGALWQVGYRLEDRRDATTESTECSQRRFVLRYLVMWQIISNCTSGVTVDQTKRVE